MQKGHRGRDNCEVSEFEEPSGRTVWCREYSAVTNRISNFFIQHTPCRSPAEAPTRDHSDGEILAHWSWPGSVVESDLQSGADRHSQSRQHPSPFISISAGEHSEDPCFKSSGSRASLQVPSVSARHRLSIRSMSRYPQFRILQIIPLGSQA